MKKQSANSFLILTAGIVLSVLVGIAALNFLADPLLHFHAPWFGLQPVLLNARYQNAGCIRHLEYDNVILGNSMCENFEAGWFDDAFGGKTAKLPISGSIICNLTQELSLLQPRNPKHVLINLDYDQLTMTPDQAKYQLPDYIYDTNPLNDIQYLLNFDILTEQTIPFLLCNAQGKITNLNRVYEWEGTMADGRQVVLDCLYGMNLEQEIHSSPEAARLQVQQNLALLSPCLERMPETEFVFFVSPWSMAYWYMKDQCGQLDTVRAAYLEGICALAQHPNVTIYFWDDAQMRDITANLDNYRDIAHYNKAVSQLLAERISRNEGQLPAENCADALNRFFDYLDSFPYEALYSK